MMSRFLSVLAVCAVLMGLFAGIGAVSAAAEGSEYVVVLEDFEDAERVQSFLPVPPQDGTMIQTKSKAYRGSACGLFVNSAAYGAVKDNANYANKVLLTYDNQLMADGQTNVFDAFRLYIQNPGEEVTFRMQFVTALGNTFFCDASIPHSEEFVAYDFPIRECRKNSMESKETFGGETDPFNAQIWEILFVYVSDTRDLKLYVDDLSLVKYDMGEEPVTTPPEETTTTTEPTQSTIASAVTTAPTASRTTAARSTASTTGTSAQESPSESFPVWGIVLIVVGVLAVAAGVFAVCRIVKRKKSA